MTVRGKRLAAVRHRARLVVNAGLHAAAAHGAKCVAQIGSFRKIASAHLRGQAIRLASVAVGPGVLGQAIRMERPQAGLEAANAQFHALSDAKGRAANKARMAPAESAQNSRVGHKHTVEPREKPAHGPAGAVAEALMRVGWVAPAARFPDKTRSAARPVQGVPTRRARDASARERRLGAGAMVGGAASGAHRSVGRVEDGRSGKGCRP